MNKPIIIEEIVGSIVDEYFDGQDCFKMSKKYELIAINILIFGKNSPKEELIEKLERWEFIPPKPKQDELVREKLAQKTFRESNTDSLSASSSISIYEIKTTEEHNHIIEYSHKQLQDFNQMGEIVWEQSISCY
jgi:hypothetical protein